MPRHGLSVLLLASFLLAACDATDPSLLDDPVVVEAFLYAGEPVDDIWLTEAIPLLREDTVAMPIPDADVRLVRDGQTFVLDAVGGGQYAYLGDDLTIAAGDRFRLEIDHQGTLVTAETTVPPAPSVLALSAPSLEVPSIGGPGNGGPGGPPGGGQGFLNALTLSWQNTADDLHYVVIESAVDGEPQYILPEFFRERFVRFRLVTQPTRDPFFDISLRSLEVFGLHRATVYRVNQEYAALYENREQDSRDLNEPPTNIEGGIGVFSAFNSRTVSFEVVPEG